MKGLITLLMVLATIKGFTQDCSTFKVESKSVSAKCNGGLGSILLTKVQGGSGYGTYTYKWSDGYDKQNLDALAGVYTVTVTDSNGCVINVTDTIKEPSKIDIKSTVIPNYGYATIDNVVTGGMPPYTYDYFEYKSQSPTKGKIKTVEDFVFLSTGYYRVRVTDSVGCTMETKGWVQVKDVDVADGVYIKEYPNPINIYSIIEYKVDPKKVNVITFTSMSTYEVVYEKVLDPSLNKLEILTVDWKNGQYLVTLKESDIIVKSIKVVVSH